MRESRVWAWIERHIPNGVHFERIEVKFPAGMADCFWSDNRQQPARCGWLELKYCEPTDKEFRAGRIPKIRPSQPLFLSRQARNGVPAGILLRVGLDNFYLWRSDGTNEWNSMIQGTAAIAHAIAFLKAYPSIDTILQTFLQPL